MLKAFPVFSSFLPKLLLIVSSFIQFNMQSFLPVMNQREITEEELSIANKLKSEGNQLMKDKKFEGKLYSQGRC